MFERRRVRDDDRSRAAGSQSCCGRINGVADDKNFKRSTRCARKLLRETGGRKRCGLELPCVVLGDD
jgi:hypothetical protein